MANSESRSRAEAPPDRLVRQLPYGDAGLLSHEDEFLAQLGERVREMRMFHGMSRRELARRSRISDRYVAQIEAGKGNVSIMLLMRIALVFRSLEGAVASGCEGRGS